MGAKPTRQIRTKRQKSSSNNYAFIDSQNLHLSIRSFGWRLDHKRFRIYLKEKYGVSKVFLFIGYVEGNNTLYKLLQDAGFICIFKPTLKYKDGTTKGNCDVELVLQAMIEYPNYDQAVIVTGDGDFFRPYLRYMNDLKNKLTYIKKRLPKDKTFKSDFSIGDG